MPLIRWQASFNIDIKELDQQHQLLVKLLNELYDAMSAGKEKEELGTLLSRISAFAAMHFAKEEHYFDTFGYPHSDKHKQEHIGFERKLSDFEDDFKAGRANLSKEILAFLFNWLVAHIKGSDRTYAPFLNARGIQ